MKIKIFLCIYSILALMIFLQPLVYAANMQEVDYSSHVSSPSSTNSVFAVKVLKYEPYPVNAGDWFNLWLKVENVGMNDALNAQFTLAPEYPFYSNDSLVRDYGRIFGIANAYQVNQDKDASQIVLKYRVRVDNNAPVGTSNLKFLASTSGNTALATTIETDLPIEIADTKTNFSITLRDMTSQISSFVVTNIGDNIAKAVTFDVEQQDGVVLLRGEKPFSLGDLSRGDVAVADMGAVPKQGVNNIKIKIDYTDTSGARTTVEKTVPIEEQMIQGACAQDSSKEFLKWIFGLVGLITGAFIIILFGLIRQKRHASKR